MIYGVKAIKGGRVSAGDLRKLVEQLDRDNVPDTEFPKARTSFGGNLIEITFDYRPPTSLFPLDPADPQ